MSSINLINVQQFVQRVMDLSAYRNKLYQYLITKMNAIAPNLTSLIGKIVRARLISHAGSLSNLAKCPSSTLQILGAEKALFRTLKARGNTPKYRLIFHSSFIGCASAQNKGRLAHYLANKCSIASCIDCFSDMNTTIFGEKLREQVEEMLDFHDKGVASRKNVDVMKAAIEATIQRNEEEGVERKDAEHSAKKKKKNKIKEVQELDSVEEYMLSDVVNGYTSAELGTEKKKKKRKQKDVEEVDVAVAVNLRNGHDTDQNGPAKKKKKNQEAAHVGDIEMATDGKTKKKKKRKTEGED